MLVQQMSLVWNKACDKEIQSHPSSSLQLLKH